MYGLVVNTTKKISMVSSKSTTKQSRNLYKYLQPGFLYDDDTLTIGKKRSRILCFRDEHDRKPLSFTYLLSPVA